MPHSASPPHRRVRTLARGVSALCAIVALLLGIPWALLALGGNPLPSELLGFSDVVSALTRPDDGRLFLSMLSLLAWLGWASFAVGLVVEILGAVRGRTPRRLPVLRFQQQAAAALVSTVVGAFVVGPAGMATAAAQPEIRPYESPVAQVTTTPSPVAESNDASADSPAVPNATAPAHRQHVVKAGESLWRIAENELGDGARWPEIAELNYGRPQPNGRALDDTHWIDPGWTLLIPVDQPEPEPPATATATHQHVVVKGDTLWDIAEEQLGDPTRYPELYEASKDTIQPDGRRLTDPDLIIPGWTITVRTDHEVSAQPPAASPPPPPNSAPEPGAEAQPQTPPEPDPIPEPASEQVPEPPAAEQAAPPAAEEVGPPIDRSEPEGETVDERRAAPPAEPPTVDGEATAEDPGDPQAAGLPIRTIAGVGSLLAAAVIAYLAAKRRAQQRRRQPGERIAMPDGDAVATERELRTVADPLSVLTVDQALRGLARNCAERGVPLPPVRLARLTAEQLELYLAEPAELPPPFQATAEPHVWFLPAAARSAIDAAAVPAPYPSLVTIGHLDDGHLMVDLERLGTLALVGDQDGARQIAAALAVELATSPWADDLQITLVGLCPELAGTLDTGRIRYLPSVGTLLDELSRRAQDDRAALAEARVDSLDAARAHGVAPATWTPEIVLLGTDLTSEQRHRLTQLVDALPRVAVAAVTSGLSALGQWTLELDATNPEAAVLQPIGARLNPQRLDDPSYERVLELLDRVEETGAQQWDASQPVDEPAALDPPLDEAAASDDLHHGGPSDDDIDAAGPTILLLGPVEVEGATGPVEQSKHRQLTEIAAYIALHPGLDHRSLDEAIWPGSRVTQNTRNTAISKLRRWLGRDEHGHEYLPRVDNGYRFHPAVTTDWDSWIRLVGEDPRKAGSDRLIAALELVRGQPFTGVNPRRYAWAEQLKQDMISAVVDAAHELATRALETHNAHLARKAATVGLQVEPGMELLWRDRIMAEHLANNRPGIEDAVARMTAISDELGDDLEEETIELIHGLLPTQSGPGTRPELSSARP